jgi:hypothetical protein
MYFFVCVCICANICTSLQAAENNAGEGDNTPVIYYHWVNENHLLLWREDDEEPIKAVLEENTWKLPSEIMADPKWHAALKDCIPQDYIKEIPAGKEIWKVFLNYIYKEKQPDNNKMRLKYPDVSLYIQIISPEKKKWIFITGSELYSDSFTKIDSIKFDTTIKGMIQFKDLNAFKESLKLKIEKSKEGDFWNVWIDQIITSDDPLFYNYQAKVGKTGWLWAEKVDSKNLITGLRSQPAKPKIQIKTIIVTKPVPIWFREFFSNNSNFIGIGAIFILLLCLYFINGFRFRRLKSIPVEKIKILFDTLRKKDKQIVEGMQDLVKKKETLINDFDKKLSAFSEENLVQQLGEGALKFYQESDKKEKNQNPKTWIETELRTLKNIKEVTVPNLKKDINKLADEKKELKSENEKISNEMKEYFNVEGENLAERWSSIVMLINTQKGLIQSQMKVAEEMTRQHEAKGKDLTEKWTSIKTLINNQKKLIETREKDIKKLQQDHQSEIALFKIYEKRWKGIDDNLRKIESLNQVLWKSLIDIQSNSPGKSLEIATIVSFLLYYSQFHLKEAIYHDHKQKKEMMLSNLLVITGKMKERHDVLNNKLFEGFNEGHEQILKDFDGSRIEKFEPAKTDHRNAYLFQNLLKRLRDVSKDRLNFRPFYFDVDEDGKVHQAM